MSSKDFTYKPRILFISHSGDLYGAERSLLTLVIGLKALDTYEIMVFIPAAGPLSEACDREAIPFRIVPFERWIGLRYHPIARYLRRIKNRLRIGKLIREAKRWMPDIVYSNTIASPAGAMLTERLSPKPLHLWHARELPGDKATGFGLFDYGKDASMRLIARSSDCFICNSQYLHDQLVPVLQKFSASSDGLRTAVVYNGLDITERNEPLPAETEAAKGTEKSLRLVMAGGISAVKNYEEAVEAVGILAGKGIAPVLEIYGSGSAKYVLRLRKIIERSGLERQVRLMGYHRHIEVALTNADMLLVTSKMETFGRTAVEAMLAGCPVISSDAGALPEIISDGDTGLIYRSGVPEQLASQIEKMSTEPELREKIIRKAREYAQARFSTARVVSEIDRILQDLLYQKNREDVQ